MSHFEKKTQSLLAGLALILAFIVPAKMWGQERQPAAIHPVGSLVLSVEPTLPADLVAAYNQSKSENLSPQNYTWAFPQDLASGQDSRIVLSRIADSNLQNWWNSESVQSSFAGHSVTQIESSMTGQLFVSENTSVQHKLNLQVQALETLTKLDYSGFFDASVFYVAKDYKTGVEIINKFFAKQEVVLSHETSPTDELSRVSIRWQW